MGSKEVLKATCQAPQRALLRAGVQMRMFWVHAGQTCLIRPYWQSGCCKRVRVSLELKAANEPIADGGVELSLAPAMLPAVDQVTGESCLPVPPRS